MSSRFILEEDDIIVIERAPAETFHLEGQHDQKAHGNRGVSIREIVGPGPSFREWHDVFGGEIAVTGYSMSEETGVFKMTYAPEGSTSYMETPAYDVMLQRDADGNVIGAEVQRMVTRDDFPNQDEAEVALTELFEEKGIPLTWRSEPAAPSDPEADAADQNKMLRASSLTEIYGGSDGRGNYEPSYFVTASGETFEISADVSTTDDGSLGEAEGVIMNADGETVGTFKREFDFESGRADNAAFDIKPEYQGQGIGTAFLDATESALPNLGIEKIRLQAVDVGRYAWMARGYGVSRNDRQTVTEAWIPAAEAIMDANPGEFTDIQRGQVRAVAESWRAGDEVYGADLLAVDQRFKDVFLADNAPTYAAIRDVAPVERERPWFDPNQLEFDLAADIEVFHLKGEHDQQNHAGDRASSIGDDVSLDDMDGEFIEAPAADIVERFKLYDGDAEYETTSGARLYRADDDRYVTLEADGDGTYVNIHSDLYEVDVDVSDLEERIDESWREDIARSIVYHGTRDGETAAAIMENGLQRMNETRGLNNRYVGAAVYTSTEPELAGSYGQLFEVDLPRAIADGVIEPGDLQREPGYSEADAMQAVASSFDDYSFDAYGQFYGSGEDPNTVVIGADIPPEYLKFDEDGTGAFSIQVFHLKGTENDHDQSTHSRNSAGQTIKEVGQTIPENRSADAVLDEWMSTPEEFAAAQKLAAEKARNVPKPTQAQIDKNMMMLEKAKEGGRPGGWGRGNSYTRRARGQALFEEFGGTPGGSCPCAHCGIKVSPRGEGGFAPMTQDKILTAVEGGTYGTVKSGFPNLIPACGGCNSSRNEASFDVRPEWEQDELPLAASAGVTTSDEYVAASATGKPVGWDTYLDVEVGTQPRTGEYITRTVDVWFGPYTQHLIDGEPCDPATIKIAVDTSEMGVEQFHMRGRHDQQNHARGGALADVPFSDVKIAYRPRHPDGKADPGEVVWARVPFEEGDGRAKDRPVLIIGRTKDGKNLVGVQLTSKRGRDRVSVGTGDWDRQGRDSYMDTTRFIQVDDANYRREGAYVKKPKFQAIVDVLTEAQNAPDVDLAVERFHLQGQHDQADHGRRGAASDDWEDTRSYSSGTERETQAAKVFSGSITVGDKSYDIQTVTTRDSYGDVKLEGRIIDPTRRPRWVGDDMSGEVGKFMRTIKKGNYVQNDVFIINEEYKGQGIGTEFLDYTEARLRDEFNISHIELKAVEDGRYAWASRGYGTYDDIDPFVTKARRAVANGALGTDNANYRKFEAVMADWEDRAANIAPVYLGDLIAISPRFKRMFTADDFPDWNGVKEFDPTTGDVLDRPFDLAVQAFHLQGQHDQDDHGNRAGTAVLDSPAAALISGERVTVPAAEALELLIEVGKADDGVVDMTNLSIEGNPYLFAGVSEEGRRSRLEMPQVPSRAIQSFHDHLEQEGVTFNHEVIDPASVKSTQTELDATKVGQMLSRVQDGTYQTGHDPWISNDGYILDGHHRWATMVVASVAGIEYPAFNVQRVSLPIDELLTLADEFNEQYEISAKSIDMAQLRRWITQFHMQGEHDQQTHARGRSIDDDEEDYRGTHRPSETGPRIHDLLESEMTDGLDVYENPHFFTGYAERELTETMRQLRRAKGNPDATVTIYRAAPEGTDIRDGDWVSLSPTYARTHAESGNAGDTPDIIELEVPARTVRWSVDDLMEYGYFPDLGDKAIFSEDDLAMQQFHLQGQHDQQTHAGDRAAADDGYVGMDDPAIRSDGVPFAHDSVTSLADQYDSNDEFEQARRMKRDGAARVEMYMGEEDKQAIADELNSIVIGDLDGRDGLLLSGDVENNVGTFGVGLDRLTLGTAMQLSTLAKEWQMDMPGYERTEILQSAVDRFNAGGDPAELSRILNDEFDTSVAKAAVDWRNSQWQQSAVSPAMVAFQLATARSRKLYDAERAMRSYYPGGSMDIAEEMGRRIPTTISTILSADAFAVEDTIQMEVRRDSRATVTLFRGIKDSGHSATNYEGATATQGNPLSSWTTSEDIANGFAGQFSTNGGYVLRAEVPVDQIAGMATVNGWGSTKEREVIVLGNLIELDEVRPVRRYEP